MPRKRQAEFEVLKQSDLQNGTGLGSHGEPPQPVELLQPRLVAPFLHAVGGA